MDNTSFILENLSAFSKKISSSTNSEELLQKSIGFLKHKLEYDKCIILKKDGKEYRTIYFEGYYTEEEKESIEKFTIDSDSEIPDKSILLDFNNIKNDSKYNIFKPLHLESFCVSYLSSIFPLKENYVLIAGYNGKVNPEKEKKHYHSFIIISKLISSLLVNIGTTKVQAETSKPNITEDSVEEQEIDEKPLILLIEDDAGLRLDISTKLKKYYRVKEATNGQEGLSYAFESIPDLIITDWMMPVMDGITFLGKIKENELTNHIPIIMLTARDTSMDKVEGYQVGADAYITKPIEFDLVVARIQNLLKSREKLQKKYSEGQIQNIKIKSADDKFINRLYEYITKNIENAEYSVDDLSNDIGISRSQLHRKLTAICGEQPIKFIRRIRLEKAAQLLKTNKLNINEVMYSVGFSSPSYFAKVFKEIYNVTPSEFINS